MKFDGPIHLASRSPRRVSLLREAGFDVRPVETTVDDALLSRGDASPREWVTSLAHLKARAAFDRLRAEGAPAGVVIGADTVCVVGDEILGQPCDAADASRMIRLMAGRVHHTITGVCMLSLESGGRRLFCDEAEVWIGGLKEDEIEQYIASGDWRGKAGAYNLSERVAAGWPIEVTGDPATVMGLPMRRLLPMLRGGAQAT